MLRCQQFLDLQGQSKHEKKKVQFVIQSILNWKINKDMNARSMNPLISGGIKQIP
jgi:hypothetical protein